jgi:lipopolysaccharide transport system ATP-binding protein
MAELAIRIQDIGKLYRVGRLRERHDTLRDAFSSTTRKLLQSATPSGWARRRGARKQETIWALRHVTFDVQRGDVLGIIGANGAGKSTLLKILSRITEPTTGYAEVHGRVGSLLEVGTGFHQELTGRENLYLNGAVLGMPRREIDHKLDQIVAFAEVEQFLDTPVKHYSSGMYLRLAFAVAAHLEPDILIVDEVLAVGDAQFQKKCLGRMDDVAAEGRTVLFVSHNMNAIRRLCRSCLLLERGELIDYGEPARLITRYLAGAASAAPRQWIDTSQVPRKGTGEVTVQALQFASDREDVAYQPYPEGPLTVHLEIHSDAVRTIESLAVTIYDQHGAKLVNADSLALGQSVLLQHGPNYVEVRIEALHLNPGGYALGFWVAGLASTVYDFAESAVQLEIVDVQSARFGRTTGKDGLVPCRFAVYRHGSPAQRAIG